VSFDHNELCQSSMMNSVLVSDSVLKEASIDQNDLAKNVFYVQGPRRQVQRSRQEKPIDSKAQHILLKDLNADLNTVDRSSSSFNSKDKVPTDNQHDTECSMEQHISTNESKPIILNSTNGLQDNIDLRTTSSPTHITSKLPKLDSIAHTSNNPTSHPIKINNGFHPSSHPSSVYLTPDSRKFDKYQQLLTEL
jgi:hypothetical protein